VARAYDERLAKEAEIVRPALTSESGRIGWFAYVVRLSERFSAADRDAIVDGMRAAGLGCQRYFSPLHLQPHIREARAYSRGDFPITETTAGRTLALPFFNALTDAQIREVCETLQILLRHKG
jgi:perosamine synthetase